MIHHLASHWRTYYRLSFESIGRSGEPRREALFLLAIPSVVDRSLWKSDLPPRFSLTKAADDLQALPHLSDSQVARCSATLPT